MSTPRGPRLPREPTAKAPRPKPVRLSDIAGKRKRIVYVDRTDGSTKTLEGRFSGVKDEYGRLEFWPIKGFQPLFIFAADVRHIGGLRAVYNHTCQRCGHTWEARLAEPRACAACNSPYWNRARVLERPKAGDKERAVLAQYQAVVSDVLRATSRAADADEPGSFRARLAACYRAAAELLKPQTQPKES